MTHAELQKLNHDVTGKLAIIQLCMEIFERDGLSDTKKQVVFKRMKDALGDAVAFLEESSNP